MKKSDNERELQRPEYVVISMRIQPLLALPVLIAPSLGWAQADHGLETATIASQLRDHQYDLNAAGRDFLINEARKSSFFLLGELHGENEIPALLHMLWPEMMKAGYSHIAAELSPWAAQQLEFGPGGAPDLRALWTRMDARFVHIPAAGTQAALWGCDMEEGQAEQLIRDLAALNPENSALQQMNKLVGSGFNRSIAPQLLDLEQGMGDAKDRLIQGISLRQNLLDTLQIEVLRLNPNTRYEASVTREGLMKKLFVTHYERASKATSRGSSLKVMLRFGRNHLHRGYDARGVSTLGNFVAELAALKGLNSFHVGAFAAGGQEKLVGPPVDADERRDEAAFQLLASVASYPAAIFDLRPLRGVLHRIPADARSPLERNLIYWADSYDAIICYQRVTPLN